MLNKDKTYLVLNYSGSPVAVHTRYDSYLIPKGSQNEPASIPLSIDEILQINSSSPVFKIGLLWFEPEFAADIYEECRIKNCEDILSDSAIEDTILHPTLEKLKKLLSIENEQYFERCYGIYIGLKNSNHSIQENVKNVMIVRRKELRAKKYHTDIVLSEKDNGTAITEEAFNAQKEENAKLANEVSELKAMMAQLIASQNNGDTLAPIEKMEAAVEKKKSNKGRPKKVNS